MQVQIRASHLSVMKILFAAWSNAARARLQDLRDDGGLPQALGHVQRGAPAKPSSDAEFPAQAPSRGLNVALAPAIRAAPARELLKVCALVLTVLTMFAPTVRAQACPAGWLPAMGFPGADFQIRALAVIPEGDVIAGGDFSVAGDVRANRIARYNRSTGRWSPLAQGTGPISALAILPNGDVIAGGEIQPVDNFVGNNIARYNRTTDTWSALGSGTNGRVSALIVLPGGDLLVGGSFTNAGGVPSTSRIARYSPTTGAWSAVGGGTDGTVRALAVAPGGDVIVGGNFTTAGGVAANYIARYSPATGVWSALGLGTSGSVAAVAVLPNGDVLAGGGFTTAGGGRRSEYCPILPNHW